VCSRIAVVPCRRRSAPLVFLAPRSRIANDPSIAMLFAPRLARPWPAAACALLAACSEPSQPPPGPQGPTLSTASAIAVSGRNVRVTWGKLDDAEVVIERQDPGKNTFTEVARRAASHGQFLDLALQPSSAYRYRLKACKAEVCGAALHTDAAQTFASATPSVELLHTDPRVSDDVVVMGVGSLAGDYTGTGRIIAVARDGQILWEYVNNKEGLITEVQMLPGRRLAAEQLVSLVDIDLDGSVQKKFTERLAHHALDLLDDGRYAVLTFDRIQQGGSVWLGDGIAVLSADWSAVQWEWLARDHIPKTELCGQCIDDDPYFLGFDWTHANGLHFDGAEQKFYVNIRNLNRIYKVDYPSGAVDWVMGDGGDFGAGLWSHSHSPQYLPGNRVLMLDNGLHRSGGELYTRALEVAYDPVAKTAEIVWEYRETPDSYSFILGSVHRQENGNTFIAYGYDGRLLEVTADKSRVWELKLQTGYGTYKAITVPKDFFSGW
jgi:hypothetical protein